MDENVEFDFVPDANERQDILPYQYEPEPVEVSRDSDSENDSDGESDRTPKQILIVNQDELETQIGEFCA